MRLIRTGLLTCAAIMFATAFSATGRAAEPKPRALASGGLNLPITKATLANGLRVVMYSDHTSPTVAVTIVYDVGSRNEERGRSGFAHLFEHMMFQGSQEVPRGEHFKLVSGHGGTLNGTTNVDRTNYFEVLPSSELALGLFLEADRLKTLDISQSNFENQRAVVKEEYRMRYENAAYMPARIRLEELVYEGYWPYAHPTIGTLADLDAAQLSWVKSFHTAYYAPNNAVLSIAGDFEPTEAMALVHQYFDDAKANPAVPKYSPEARPVQAAPRGDSLIDVHAKYPAIMYGWPGPMGRTPDTYALNLAAMLMTDGESSRLYRKLVRDRAVAASVDASFNDYRGPGWFSLEVKVAGDSSIEKVEALLKQELASLAKTGPTSGEMTKLKNRIRAAFILGFQSNLGKALNLGQYELYWGDANLLNREVERYLAVSADGIRRVIASYLVAQKQTRVEDIPGSDMHVSTGGAR